MGEQLLPLADMPEILAKEVEKNWQHFTERCSAFSDVLAEKLKDNTFAGQLVSAWSGSHYLVDVCQRQPEMFCQLVESAELQTAFNGDEIYQQLKQQLSEVGSAEALAAILRQYRTRAMLRIIWRDLNRMASWQETTRDVTQLAEASIQLALDFHYRQLCDEVGVPTAIVNDQPVAQQLVVIGMGKLGAGELNLSSDIDLIFAFPQAGKTEGGKTSLDNQAFFTRLGQRLIQALDQPTADGFVFRVDMRLRPYGQSGALVLSFDAMEEYYQDQGRDWERYAMIKARVVAGDQEQGEKLMAMLKPFTYRRYIDFTAIESLRSMKLMIQKEVKRRRLHNDVKLGAGGIREIEFIVQSFQLLRGGKDRGLQERRLSMVLTHLADRDYLPAEVVDELRAAYAFLRDTEHAIQAFRDQQTQALPDADYPRLVLAWAMGFDSWETFFAALEQHRENVSGHFQQVITPPEEDTVVEKVNEQWSDLWGHDMPREQALQYLQDGGYEDAETALTRLLQLRDGSVVQRMQSIGQDRLNQFMPLLLQAVTSSVRPSETLLRILPLVESVLRRTAYLLLLVENPVALKQLVILCSASPWISSQLARHPALLDELLDARTLYTVPDKEALRIELQQQILRLHWDDLEAHMEALRYFKLAHVLRVAASEVSGHLPLMRVSDYLTYIAEVILEHVLELAWHNLVEKHGLPQKADGVPCDKDFIIVGYGKLGGIELGHGSDLDLVFIHDAASGMATDGERAIDNSIFFTRLGQRMIHILTAQTPMGALYDVDMRLRPSGNSGLLVASLKAFSDYQDNEAWTWEHQALVRARVVAGDRALAQRFEQVRAEVLCRQRDTAGLRQEVIDMRDKMRDHLLPKELGASEEPLFHLKQAAGGIVDIEFMVQYAVLAWSHQYPSLAVYTDNIRILEALQREGLFSEQEVELLTEAYKEYRANAHLLSLQQQEAQVPVSQVQQHRDAVITKWQQLMGATTQQS